MATTQIDQDIIAKSSRALREFYRTPQGKLIELIGRSAVEWRGGAWNDRLSKICFCAGEEACGDFLEDETRVLTELYERMTTQRKKDICTRRAREEVEAIVAFWWKLQTYRRWWLERKGRHDTVEEILSDEEIQAVKRDLEDYEICLLYTSDAADE